MFGPGSKLPSTLKDLVQANEGWQLIKDKDGCFVLTRQHPRGPRKGKDMQTWEVLRDNGIHTYHMEDNPAYAYIIYTR